MAVGVTPVLAALFTLFLTLLDFPPPPLVSQNLKEFIYQTTTLAATQAKLTDSVANPYPIFGIGAESYDFIIVGGGSAGSVIASRLSENPSFKVLLLEAGGDPTELHNIPALAVFNLHHPDYDWGYHSIPDPDYCRACKDDVNAEGASTVPHHVDHGSMRPSDWVLKLVVMNILASRGKLLGGCSSMNLMIYQRGNPNDFNAWANLTQDESWTYQNVLPFFKKSENYMGGFPNTNGYHGVGGPLTVSRPEFQPMVEDWMKAGKELGFDDLDPNGWQTSGFSHGEATINDGVRASTYNAFVKPNLNRRNLKIIRYAHVLKVNFDYNNNAVGVTYKKNGQTITIRAEKEVILSAGAFGSPQLLMLSGIGDRNHLQSLGIPVIRHSPGVGMNLQDHVLTFFGPFILNDTVSFKIDRDLTATSIAEYGATKDGKLASNIAAGVGLFNTSSAEKSWPNIMIFQLGLGIHQSFPEDIETIIFLKDGVLKQYLQKDLGKDANVVMINLARPRSSGSIRLKSTNPMDKPLVDFGYFQHPDDMLDMIEGLKFVVRLYEETNAFGKYNATLVSTPFPGCENHPPKSDAYYECYIRTETSTMWHQCCTNKMGSNADPLAVLDSQLRVRGVNRLRVADASAMPIVTNANTNAPTIMIGERAADFIKQTWA